MGNFKRIFTVVFLSLFFGLTLSSQSFALPKEESSISLEYRCSDDGRLCYLKTGHVCNWFWDGDWQAKTSC